MDGGVSARRATAADAGRITTIIALAFAEDPVWKPWRGPTAGPLITKRCGGRSWMAR